MGWSFSVGDGPLGYLGGSFALQIFSRRNFVLFGVFFR